MSSWREEAEPVAANGSWRDEAEPLDESRFPGEPGAPAQASVPLAEGEGARGFASRVADGYIAPALAYLAEKGERYTAAPGRAAVDALAKQGTIFDAADAFRHQFGEDPTKAPTRKDLAAYLGVTDDTPMSERFPSLYTDEKEFLKKGLKLSKGGPLDFSPAGAVGEVAGMASDPISYVSPKGVVDAVKKGFAPVSRVGNRVANNVLFSVPGEVTDRYLANPEAIRGAKTLPELGQTLADTANSVTKDIGAASERAAAARGASTELIPKAKLLGAYDLRLADKTLTDAERRTLLLRREKVAALGDELTDDQVYKEIRELDELADWDSPLPSKGKALVNKTRHDVRTVLGDANPVFDEQQKEAAKRIGVRDAIVERFGMKRGESGGLIPSDSTTSALRDVGRANKTDREAVLSQIRDLGYGDMVPGVQASLDKSTLSAGSTNGARRTAAGTLIGGAIGYATGGVPGIGTGGVIGGAVGGAVDRYSGRIARASMDVQRGVGRMAGKAGELASRVKAPQLASANTAFHRPEDIVNRARKSRLAAKFAPALERAAQRGEDAVATTHFLLQQQEPEYRQAFQETDE